MIENLSTLSNPATIELDELLHDYLLGLVLIAGGSHLSGNSPVQWVHSSDLLDPTPFLTPRTVLLTTGRQFEAQLELQDAEEYTQRLVSVGATALGVGIGLQWDRIPPTLIAACDKFHLPLFRVPYDTPFLAVVRTAARLIESNRVEQWGREEIRGGFVTVRQNMADAERALRLSVLRLLRDGHREHAENAAAPMLPRLPSGHFAVVMFEPPKSSDSALQHLLTDTPGVLSAREANHLTVIAEPGEVTRLRRALTGLAVPAGISERGNDEALPELFEQAGRALELANSTSAPLVYRPEMHPGVLQILQHSPEAARRAHGLLAPLKQHDQRHGDDLLNSLRVWLSHHGQTSAAAAELGVHRHTLRNRILLATDLLHRNLDTPEMRAELWAAFSIDQ